MWKNTLDPRYEIRRLGPEHLDWAIAIFVHSNTLDSSVWSRLQSNDKTHFIYQQFLTADPLIRPAILSGLSYGVFDREYIYNYPESEKSGGKLHWDTTDYSVTEEQILQQMDFPLVSVAMSVERTHSFDTKTLEPFCAVLPGFGHAISRIEELDNRSEEEKSKGRVLDRRGTSTRADYERKGLMRYMAYWLMDEAARLGFDAIEITSVNDMVIRVWKNPPPPYRATTLCGYNIRDYEVEENGMKVYPYKHVDQVKCKIRVDLK